MQRTTILFIFFLTIFFALCAKLFYWQVLKGSELSRQARNQYESDKTISASRGNILSSDGSFLVGRLDAWLMYATPPQIKDSATDIANEIAPILIDDRNDKQELMDEVLGLQNSLSKKGISWIALKHKVSNQKKKEIQSLGLSGIGFEQEEARVYPEALTAAQLLGFVGKNDEGRDKGYFGLEGYYDLTLTGKPGVTSREKDAKGLPILLGDNKEITAVKGVDLFTNIDKGIQIIVEKNLKEGISKYGAKGGVAIVMDPLTGALLAMASFPSYDPAKYYDYTNELFRNPAISDTFEPGSIFKVLIMASGLDAKVITPNTTCPICTGPLKVDKYFISTWNDKYFPDSTMTDVIVHSDNVGMAYVGQQLGPDRLYDYLSKFGIGKPTGVDLQGEVSPKLRERGTWNIVDLATASFGQGVAVTPMEMVRAVGAIANGGKIVTPQVVGKLLNDGWNQEIKPKIGEQVVSREAAAEITAMMVEVAEKGESKWARIPGFKVAAKTGTAQIPVAGHYDEKKTIASFIAFAPADKPRFVMLVILNQPTTSPWASETAAPTWYGTAKELFPYLRIQPTGD
ncbi:penicillin-binding protein 2 [Candidatus Woesebacteria bacterium]|nr:penicillin-binding protein 2 [Candidatus Woesebacteria bacterium]